MDEDKIGKFYVDWWNIRKSTVYGLVITIVVLASIGAGLWWASRNNWFMLESAAVGLPDTFHLSSGIENVYSAFGSLNVSWPNAEYTGSKHKAAASSTASFLYFMGIRISAPLASRF